MASDPSSLEAGVVGGLFEGLLAYLLLTVFALCRLRQELLLVLQLLGLAQSRIGVGFLLLRLSCSDEVLFGDSSLLERVEVGVLLRVLRTLRLVVYQHFLVYYHRSPRSEYHFLIRRTLLRRQLLVTLPLDHVLLDVGTAK